MFDLFTNRPNSNQTLFELNTELFVSVSTHLQLYTEVNEYVHADVTRTAPILELFSKNCEVF